MAGDDTSASSRAFSFATRGSTGAAAAAGPRVQAAAGRCACGSATRPRRIRALETSVIDVRFMGNSWKCADYSRSTRLPIASSGPFVGSVQPFTRQIAQPGPPMTRIGE